MYDTVECPYCGYDNDMSDGYVDLPDDNAFDHECENCQREFEVHVEFKPIYSASRIEYIECEICGKETRDILKRGRIYPYPKDIKESNICRSCWRELMFKELESRT
ncbi:hypothetical protein [Clostridium cuniculi]|uniref:hypothetical protein n=1 Tax=Clostridium cuniculi TaxID=2548455 RepID=UPI001056C60A|nr:hypothetical protein [Clostridium cuniculi]